MSTSEPKKDEAPANEGAAESAPPDAAPEAETPAESKADAKQETAAEAQPAAAADQADQAVKASADEPVWPPPESQPAEPTREIKPVAAAVLSKLDDPVAAKPDEPVAVKLDDPGAAKHDEPALLTKPDDPVVAKHDAGKPESPAAEPSQEMALSESTLHWLVDGEQPIEVNEPNPVLAPLYDPRAPVAGRKRTFAIVGGAAVLALGIAWALHAQAARHQTAPVAQTVDSADLLIHRAEAALAQGRSAEALDLARLAIVTDSRLADAYIIMATVQRSSGQLIDARDSYRRYLELAPIGTHAAEARAALTSLPP